KVTSAPPNPIGPCLPSPSTGNPHPAPPCSQRPIFASGSRRATRSRAPPPAATSARPPGFAGGALSMAPVSHSSAAARSAIGYPTSTRISGPEPTPARPLSRKKIGPPEIPIEGCGATAARSMATISIASPSRGEDEGIRDEHLSAALGNREAPGLDLRRHAGLDAPVVQRALLRVRLGHGARRIDGPGGYQLAGEVRPGRELCLVAGADLRAVLVDHLADQLGVDRAHHLRLSGTETDLRVQRAIIHLALGARIAPGSGLAAGRALLPLVPRHRLARIAPRLVLHLLRVQHRRVVWLRRSGAHHQRPRFDHLRISGAHLR